MNWLKKFWIVFLSFLPVSAGGVSALAIGGIVFGGGIIGYSIYQNVSPVSISDALNFFSTCWSCQLFSDIMVEMSGILPMTYKELGEIIIPFALALTAIWFAWQLFQVYVGSGQGKFDAWNIGGKFGSHMVKFAFVFALLMVPLPRIISSVVIEPVFNIGLSMNYAMSLTDANQKTMRENYANCIVVTAVADSASIRHYNQNSDVGAFSPRFRHNLTCQLANVHQMTGLGMTVGWTLLNTAFNYDNMHKILWRVPLFPNVPMLFTGLLIMALYFIALLPIPLYFLEIFIKLSIDFILLPLTLLSWLFDKWAIFPKGKGNVKQIIDDVISGTLGLALTGIFITFTIIVLGQVFNNWGDVSVLQEAITQNNPQMLSDALLSTSKNTSLLTLILLGIFMTMFMLMIPALIKSIFNVTVSDKYYQETKTSLQNAWNGAKKWWKAAKK